MDFFDAMGMTPKTVLIFCPSSAEDGIFVANMLHRDKGCCTVVQTDMQMAQECASHGYDLVLILSTGQNKKEKDFERWLQEQGISGKSVALGQALGFYVDAYELGRNGCFMRKGYSKYAMPECMDAMFDESRGGRWHERRGPALRQYCERILSEGKSKRNLLLIGAKGCGKFSAALLMHKHSSQLQGKFVMVDCSGMQDGAEDSAGIICGKNASHAGISISQMLKASNGGTLFLDQVDRMPMPMQAFLAEALEERKFYDDAARKKMAYKGRLVFATLESGLEEKVLDGTFSEKLYGLMTQSVLRVPSMIEYKGDVGALAEAIAGRICQGKGGEPASLTQQAKDKLQGHAWAGNVWELYTALSAPCSFAKRTVIDADDIFLMTPLKRADICSEEKELRKVLEETRGNVSEAGRILGKNRSTIMRKMKKYKFSREEFLRG